MSVEKKNRSKLNIAKIRRKLISVLASIVVFSTTYALILPAVTLSQDAASEDPGIYIESLEQEYTAPVEEYIELSEEFEPAEAVEEPEQDTAAEAQEIEEITQPEEGEETAEEPELEEAIDEIEETVDPEDSADEETAPEMAAQSFFAEAGGVSVSVEADEGAFPTGTEMTVREVGEDEILDSVSDVVGGEIVRVHAVDITFTDLDGNEIEPAIPIRVTMSAAAVEEAEPVIVHVDGEGEAEIIAHDEEASEAEEIVFDAEAFSVYAIVYTVDYYYRSATGETFKIELQYNADAGIPDDAELVVSELTEGYSVYGLSYDEYVAFTENALGLTEGSAQYIRLFDIKIVDANGEKVELAAPVEVRIELADMEAASYNTQIVHFADEAEIPDVLENVEVAEAEEEGTTLTFEADGFSVYGIVDAPEPVAVGVQTVSTLAELFENTECGFVLAYKGGTEYFTNTVKNNNVFTVTTVAANASTWYIEPIEGESYQCRIYTYIDGVKQYMKQKASGGNDMYLADEGTTFEISQAAEGLFYFKHSTDNRWLQYSNGGGGIRLYTDHNNAANSRITITYAASYAVQDDVYELDGKTYGIAYHDESATAAALTTEGQTVGNQARLAAEDMVMRPDVLDNEGVLLVASNSDLVLWTFESVGADKYYIKNGSQYLTLKNGALTLTDEADSTYSVFTATPGTGEYSGKWHFTVNGYSLNLPNGSANGFNGATGSGAATWMNLVEKSVLTEDDFTTYTAKKVSVSDQTNVYNGQQLIIYTRIWNDTTKKYEFYAVDHDGSLIRCYDTGDNIEWVGSNVNTALWDFTVYYGSDGTENYYYELQNTQYGDYIAPQMTGGQILSDSTIGINLNGRRNGEAYTTIMAWDDNNYSYAGLKVKDGKVVSCPLSEAEDFYFAVVTTKNEAEPLTTVATVNNNDYGITMKMFDFNNALSGGRDSGQQAFMGSTNGTGLLSTNLGVDGYPTGTSKVGTAGQGKSFGDLISNFSDGETTVNQLFIQSIYNESGYFQYDSTQNYATLIQADGTLGSNFTVYDQIGAFNGDNSGPTRQHGQFMPYNVISQEKGYAVLANGDTLTNQTDVLAQELPDTDPRKGEPLYLIGNTGSIYSNSNPNGESDYFFGMEMQAGFTQTASGLDDWGHDIIFEFSGDDDFWLYVDGELVIDLGGEHAAQVGTVNFRTGEITSSNGNSTLYDTFKANYTARGMSAEEISEKLDTIFTLNEKGNYVFKDYTNHTMKMFYMERGAGASNLKMRFNLASVKPGTVELSKKLSGADSPSNKLIEYPYQIWYTTPIYKTDASGAYVLDADGNKQIDGYTAGQLMEQGAAGDAVRVVYKGTNTLVPFRESLTIDGVTYKNVFLLKPGETAVIMFPEDTYQYEIIECGIDTDIYESVSVNGDEISGQLYNNTDKGSNAEEGEARLDFGIAYASTTDRPSVEYTNRVDPDAMRTLSFTKKVYDPYGNLITDAAVLAEIEQTFSFRLYLGNEFTSESAIPLANMYSYYVKDAGGNYCKWDPTEQKFVSLGITNYEGTGGLKEYLDTLTAAEKESIVFTTSMNGSISNIPAGYTVEVRDLIVGTKYKVEERDWEIPKGFTRRAADGYVRTDLEGSYIYYTDEATETYTKKLLDNSGTTAEAISDSIKSKTESPTIEIRNQEHWGLTVEKVWTDADFMQSHDDIYFAVYIDRGGTLELYPGTVRCLASPETDIYYIFEDLYDPANSGYTLNFSDFVVREVTLAKADGYDLVADTDTGEVKVKASSAEDSTAQSVTADTGSVTITPIEDGGALTIGGTPVDGEHQEDYGYTVSYRIGTSTGLNDKIRTDTVTNSRPGVEIYKTDMNGNALGGAVFQLTDADGENVAAATYTSRSADGYVTTAYLSQGTYTLTETTAPTGYVGIGAVTITIGADDSVSVSDKTLCELVTEGLDNGMTARITVKNRQHALQIKKTNTEGIALENVTFDLYRQVTESSGSVRKDYQPISGYSGLVTNSEGLLCRKTTAEDGTVTLTTLSMSDFTAGITYYLTETATVEGYDMLKADVCFTVNSDGTVKLINTGATANLTSVTEEEVVTYTLTILNGKIKKVSFMKVDIANISHALSGAEFDLYKVTAGEREETPYISGMVSDDDGMLTSGGAVVFNLPLGTYHLVETKAPAGYNLKASAVTITVTEDGVTYIDDETGIDENGDGKSEQDGVTTLKIVNSSGYELPSTGGIGAERFTVAGLLLIALAVTLLICKNRREKRA